MRVHLIKKKTIETFIAHNTGSKVPFRIWLGVIKWADWKNPSDIIKTFNSADILGRGSDRVVFNIGGNKFRMICKYHFGISRVHLFITWIGTHNAYNRICDKNEQYDIEDIG
jgi:mRNA interferase HigB